MYLIRIDHLIYERKGGEPFTLPEALAEVRGCGNAAVVRLDGTPVVLDAGSDAGPLTHAPTGRVIRRRRVYRRIPAPA